MKKILLSCAALCLIIASCKKKESDPSRSDMLSNGKWKMTAGTATYSFGGATNTDDIYAGFADCEKDNLLIFRSDKVLIQDEGATKCNSTDSQQTVSGNWALMENDSKLYFGDTTLGTFTINTLDASTLKVSSNSSITDTTSGIPVTITVSTAFTFAHQN
jgi:hypothetical protein